MPIHDWTRVSAGTFHAFHNAWITHLSETLNAGLLPTNYYALAEQHVGLAIPDILTLQATPSESDLPGDGGVALLAAPPKVGRRLIASEASLARARRTVAIRHASGHRVVAMIEVASPANKDRRQSVDEFVAKIHAAIDFGIHVLLVDLFPPGPFDPLGLHGAVWESYGNVDPPPSDRPLSLASYDALDSLPQAIEEEHVRTGDPLPRMPLYLVGESYIETPLDATYLMAYRGMPAFWRHVLEKPAAAPLP